ncbi:MAG: hypothetical protein HY953_06810, partial [Candidatus Rokubacteria bacterium]|nr:hypothetical protein [Candidatus Rokubacteria bacterium]
YAIDRRALIQAVHQGAAVPGAAMAPRPYGVWGLLEKDLAALPGYGPQKQLQVEMGTRAIALYVDFASFVINELKQVGIEA